jgi:hypothetical protein
MRFILLGHDPARAVLEADDDHIAEAVFASYDAFSVLADSDSRKRLKDFVDFGVF